MKNELQVIATIEAKSTAVAELRELLRNAVDKFRAEPGCKGYVLLEDRKQPGRFMTYETWVDEAALAKHMRAPTMHALAPKMKSLVVDDIKQDLLSILVDL